MDRNCCQSCRREIPTESGMLCRECGEELARTERPVMRDPVLRGFAAGVAVEVAAGVLVAGLLTAGARADLQRAWDDDVMEWERHAQQQYEAGWRDGARVAELQAEVAQ